MDKYFQCLTKCQFFKNIPEETIKLFLSENNYIKKSYLKDEIIANEEDFCNNLGIVAEGKISAQRVYPAGKVITINMFDISDVFGEAVIFSSNGRYPASIVSVSDCEILYIPRNEIIKLCFYDQRYLNNFLSTLSDKIIMLNNKLKSISYQTVRQKVVNYILQQYTIQKKTNLILPMSREHMAEYLDIPRPSLSRELIKLKEDGVLDFHKNSVTINNINRLESYLF